jgi:hypothetical protein
MVVIINNLHKNLFENKNNNNYRDCLFAMPISQAICLKLSNPFIRRNELITRIWLAGFQTKFLKYPYSNDYEFN